MQKLCCVRTKQHPLPVWSHKFVLKFNNSFLNQFSSIFGGNCIKIVDLRQTLRYLGVPIKSKAYMFGDNKSVVTSSTVPHSLLSKRLNILSYHRVREAIAAKILVYHGCDSPQNKSDILSKHWEFSKVFHIIRDLF